MIDAEKTKREKAAALRYKKPVAKGLNLDEIHQNLLDIVEECDNVRWYFDDDDTLLNALDGDEDETFEFKMMFGDLSAECEQLQNDLDEVMWNEDMQDAFNLWFPAVNSGEMLGWDSYETDYMPITGCYGQENAVREGRKKIMRMTKEQILDTAEMSFRIVRSYLGLTQRYDKIKAAMDILRDQNAGYLQMVKKLRKFMKKPMNVDFIIGIQRLRNWIDWQNVCHRKHGFNSKLN